MNYITPAKKFRKKQSVKQAGKKKWGLFARLLINQCGVCNKCKHHSANTTKNRGINSSIFDFEKNGV